MKISKQDLCKMFGLTIEQINKGYAENAKELREMQLWAEKHGKKYNGYTAKELQIHADRYEQLSKS